MLQRVVTALALVGATALPVFGQARPLPRGELRRMQQPPDQSRSELQRQIRQGFARAVREKVGLTEEQMHRLQPVNRKYAQQRRELGDEERDLRLSLRREMLDTISPDQNKIAQYQSRLLELQRKRLDLQQAEQNELTTFMTPLQLAKYRALQEQLRLRMEEMRRNGAPNAIPLHPDSTP